MIRHAECTRNEKQNRRFYKEFGKIKQDIVILRETKKKGNMVELLGSLLTLL
jgi:hypothetical protein